LGIGCSGSGSLFGSRHRDPAATREPRQILGGHLSEPPTDLTGRCGDFCYMYFYCYDDLPLQSANSNLSLISLRSRVVEKGRPRENTTVRG
jgi:hypothetical protein